VRQGDAAVLVARGCCGGRRLAGDLNSDDLLCLIPIWLCEREQLMSFVADEKNQRMWLM
jgi:hypothetical protein